jgi:hypothetical protein
VIVPCPTDNASASLGGAGIIQDGLGFVAPTSIGHIMSCPDEGTTVRFPNGAAAQTTPAASATVSTASTAQTTPASR